MSPPFGLNAVTFCSHDATTLSIGLRITPAFFCEAVADLNPAAAFDIYCKTVVAARMDPCQSIKLFQSLDLAVKNCQKPPRASLTFLKFKD